jgi:hypothetical protein
MTLTASIARKALASTLTALVLATAPCAVYAQATTLESVLGGESYRAAGLNKLSEAEQAELLRWLQSKGIGASATVSSAASDDAASEALRASLQEAQRVREELAAEIAAARAATEQARQERGAAMAAVETAEAKRDAAERAAKEASQDEFESRLKEPFTGWSGKTVFELENGQVWRQRLPGRYVHREGDLPRVKISKNLMGYYMMELVDHGRKVGVTRVR